MGSGTASRALPCSAAAGAASAWGPSAKKKPDPRGLLLFEVLSFFSTVPIHGIIRGILRGVAPAALGLGLFLEKGLGGRASEEEAAFSAAAGLTSSPSPSFLLPFSP